MLRKMVNCRGFCCHLMVSFAPFIFDADSDLGVSNVVFRPEKVLLTFWPVQVMSTESQSDL